MDIGIIGRDLAKMDAFCKKFKCRNAYICNLNKPLELTVISKNKTSVFDEPKGYFSPIQRMASEINGPIFVMATSDMVESIVEQIKEGRKTAEIYSLTIL